MKRKSTLLFPVVVSLGVVTAGVASGSQDRAKLAPQSPDSTRTLEQEHIAKPAKSRPRLDALQQKGPKCGEMASALQAVLISKDGSRWRRLSCVRIGAGASLARWSWEQGATKEEAISSARAGLFPENYARVPHGYRDAPNALVENLRYAPVVWSSDPRNPDLGDVTAMRPRGTFHFFAETEGGPQDVALGSLKWTSWGQVAKGRGLLASDNRVVTIRVRLSRPDVFGFYTKIRFRGDGARAEYALLSPRG